MLLHLKNLNNLFLDQEESRFGSKQDILNFLHDRVDGLGGLRGHDVQVVADCKLCDVGDYVCDVFFGHELELGYLLQDFVSIFLAHFFTNITPSWRFKRINLLPPNQPLKKPDLPLGEHPLGPNNLPQLSLHIPQLRVGIALVHYQHYTALYGVQAAESLLQFPDQRWQPMRSAFGQVALLDDQDELGALVK